MHVDHTLRTMVVRFGNTWSSKITEMVPNVKPSQLRVIRASTFLRHQYKTVPSTGVEVEVGGVNEDNDLETYTVRLETK